MRLLSIAYCIADFIVGLSALYHDGLDFQCVPFLKLPHILGIPRNWPRFSCALTRAEHTDSSTYSRKHAEQAVWTARKL